MGKNQSSSELQIKCDSIYKYVARHDLEGHKPKPLPPIIIIIKKTTFPPFELTCTCTCAAVTQCTRGSETHRPPPLEDQNKQEQGSVAARLGAADAQRVDEASAPHPTASCNQLYSQCWACTSVQFDCNNNSQGRKLFLLVVSSE